MVRLSKNLHLFQIGKKSMLLKLGLIAFNKPFNAYTYFYLHYLNTVETGANPYLHCTYIYSINTTLVNNKSSCQNSFSFILFFFSTTLSYISTYILKSSATLYTM